MVYYSIVLCCGIYEEYCLPTNCDNVIRLYPCAEYRVSVPPILSYINLNIPIV